MKDRRDGLRDGRRDGSEAKGADPRPSFVSHSLPHPLSWIDERRPTDRRTGAACKPMHPAIKRELMSRVNAITRVCKSNHAIERTGGWGAPHANTMITFADACIYILNPRPSSPKYADASQALDHLIHRQADKENGKEEEHDSVRTRKHPHYADDAGHRLTLTSDPAAGDGRWSQLRLRTRTDAGERHEARDRLTLGRTAGEMCRCRSE